MKKIYLLKLSLIALMLVFVGQAFAQNINLMSPRLVVNSPSGIAGLKKFTYSFESGSAWGRDIDSFWFNVELVKAGPDSLACTGSQSSKTDKWVLIMRGDCQFGEKAYAAQLAGAKGVLIVNNVVGAEAVGMAAGTSGAMVNIPVLMVSNADGMAMFNALNSGQVFISLTRWGFNFGNDAALVPYSVTQAPDFAVPQNQLATAGAYKLYTGALVANVGNNNQTNLVVKSTVNWTPTGGSATQVYTDTAMLASISVNDSISDMFSPRSYAMQATTTGKFDISYEVTSDSTDEQGGDNVESMTVHVTPNVFSKGRYDLAAGEPMVNLGRRYGSGPSTWGPMYYVANGGRDADKVQFQVTDGDTSAHSLLTYSAIPVYLMKWTDDNSNNVMEISEVSVKGVAARNFTVTDSNYTTINVDIDDINTPGKKVALDGNSWYWVAIDLPANFYVGVDDNSNYFSRTYAAQKYAAPQVIKEFSAPIYYNSHSAMMANTTDAVRLLATFLATHIASAASANNIDSASFLGLKGGVPSIPLYISNFPTGVSKPQAKTFDVAVYPNPAINEVNVKLSFKQASSKVAMRVIDIHGRSVYQQDLKNVKSEVVTIPVTSFANGQYYVIVTSDEGTISQQFNVSNK